MSRLSGLGALTRAAVALSLIVVVAGTLGAQNLDSLRARWRLEYAPEWETMKDVRLTSFWRGAPGTSAGSPLAFGASWRDGFVGGSYIANTRAVRDPRTGRWGPNGGSDGGLAAGFGLGDAQTAVGLSVTMASLSTFRSGLGDRTAFSFMAHRTLPGNAAVAIGVESAFIAGGGGTDGFASTFVAASKAIMRRTESPYFRAIVLSGGFGNGRFRSEEDVQADRSTINAFGSVGVLVTSQLSVAADWTGQDLNLGLSVVPFRRFPLSISPMIQDVTGTAGNGARLALGTGIGFRF